MKELLISVAAGLLITSCSADKNDVTIHLPKDFKENTLIVSHVTIDNIFTATKQEDLKVIYDTLQVKDGTAYMNLDEAGAARYNIVSPVASRMEADFYAAPGDNLEVVIKNFEPLDFEVKGTELMDDMTAMLSITRPIQDEYMTFVSSSDSIPEEEAKQIMDRYDTAIKRFVADHPNSPVVPFVILELSGDDFKEIYDKMTPEARLSILMPYAELYNRQVEEMLNEREAEELRKSEVASGTITAPGFTLTDLDGKKVSLSDFKGKWVVLDFWGSWCGWCIKGFPALKKAYEQYGDKIAVIGIDCNETEAEWREGVKNHQLPWINVYNGHDNRLYSDYKIEGFPTKAIINPEGKLVDLTTGEDPTFFDRLANFVN